MGEAEGRVTRPRLLLAKRAARYIGIAPATFNRWRRDSHQPPVPKPVETRGSQFWTREELDEFVDQLKSLRGSPAK